MPDAAGNWLVGLVGTGIGPSLSPALHEREAAALGLSYRYQRLDLDELGLGAHDIGTVLADARAAGYDGLNVTHPCKQLVVEHLDDLSPQAAALGAVNTVVLREGRAVGHNTDCSGFASALARGLPDADLDRVLLLGAGGAGAAVAHALRTAGTRDLTVVDVDEQRAARLAGATGGRWVPHRDLAAELARASGFVHATPTGMAAHPGSPVDVAGLHPDAWVAEVVYRPLETALVLAARAAGHRVLDGGAMAVFQAHESLRLFTAREPDADRMLAHFVDLARGAGTATG